MPSTCPRTTGQAILNSLAEKDNTFNLINTCLPYNKYLAKLVNQVKISAACLKKGHTITCFVEMLMNFESLKSLETLQNAQMKGKK